MKTVVLVFLAMVSLAGLSGCMDVNAEIPEQININNVPYVGAAPPAQIPRAEPGDGADLQRENHQLRERIGYLEGRAVRNDKKYRELASEMDKVRDETASLRQQQERYERALRN